MIQHIVLCDLLDHHDADELRAIMAALAALQGRIDGFVGFTCGPNRDYEGLSPRCHFGFTCDFMDMAAHQTYLADGVHRALGARLIALCRGGRDGLVVVDLETIAP